MILVDGEVEDLVDQSALIEMGLDHPIGQFFFFFTSTSTTAIVYSEQECIPVGCVPSARNHTGEGVTVDSDGCVAIVIICKLYKCRVPTRTGKPGKPGKMGRHFPVREKSGNFDQTGKVRENHTKYWKTEGISDKYYLLFFIDS